MTTTRTYQKTCTYCGDTFQSRHRGNTVRESCTRMDCLRACTAEHNAAVTAYRAERAARPKAPRQRRTAQPLYGDLAFVAAINGIATDGTGRRAR